MNSYLINDGQLYHFKHNQLALSAWISDQNNYNYVHSGNYDVVLATTSKMLFVLNSIQYMRTDQTNTWHRIEKIKWVQIPDNTTFAIFLQRTELGTKSWPENWNQKLGTNEEKGLLGWKYKLFAK